jgi:DNA-binding NtrC family response regulator
MVADPAHALVVDDERNIRKTLRMVLEERGIVVEEADTAAAAAERLGKATFDLVFLDLRLPDGDGLEILRSLHDARREGISVIVISAHGTIDSAVESMRLGAVDFLAKPFSPDDVRRAVAHVLEGPDPTAGGDYEALVAQGRDEITSGHLEAAERHLRWALSATPIRAEAYNLLGAVAELRHDHRRARAYYRAAVAFDPTHLAAQKNLGRVTKLDASGLIELGSGKRP